ncbi:MAG: Crp/Fnr family transcriptional regulator [Bacteroidota bacterium]
MEPLISFLKKDLSIPQQLIPSVIKFYQTERLTKNDFLVKKGQHCRKMCLIEQGYFRFFSFSEKKVITHWIFGKDQLVTDVASFFLQQPAKWNIQALTDMTIFSLTHTNYQYLRKRIPGWDNYEKLFLIKLMSALENRVYALLSMSAEERYQYLFQSDSNMFNELPLQYLASMLGMTPETLSRIRAKFNS